jgi:hypothetical protein
LVPPLAADPAHPDANPEVEARRALVVHPLLGLHFVRPLQPREALLLVRQIQEALPASVRASLEPLINFARVAVTASAADATVSALATDWRRTDPGDTPELHEWYYELLHACGPRYTAPVTMAIGGTPARGATESHDLGGGILGQALKDLAANTGVMAKRKDTGYKPHELDLLFRICGTPLRVDSEPSAADLPAFWQEFDKHRGKITDARSYIERHFATFSTGANLDQVIFSTNFIQDLMVNDLDGRDKFCEFKLRHRGFSLFAVGPIDINHMTGETQRREFVRQETSTLKLDETIALEKKSDQITKQLITWPKNLLEFRRYMHHMQQVCVIFFGDTFLPARHFRLMHDVSQKSHYFSSYTKTHYWSLMWQLHMAFRQYFLDGIAVLFEQLYSDIFRFRLPGSELLPADLKNNIQPVPPYVSDTGSTAGSSISDLSDSQHQPPTKKAKVVEFDGGQVFSSEIQYLKTKVSNFDPARVGRVFPGGTMDRIMGQDFKACVNGRQPCFKYLILGDCENFCRRSHKLRSQPSTGIINQIKTRFRSAVDDHCRTAAAAGGAGGGGGGGGRGGGGGGGGPPRNPPPPPPDPKQPDDATTGTAATSTSTGTSGSSSAGSASGRPGQ